MAISTNGTVIARLAGGLYNTVISNATYLEVAAQDPSALANTLYARDFAKATDLAVATTLITNLGLSSVAGLDNWVAAQLTAAGSAKGAKIVSLLNDFAGMAADTTYGAAATAFNTKVDAALAASQKTGSVESKFADAGVVAVANATFTLTTGVDGLDKFTGGAGNDTFNLTAMNQSNVLDSIDGGAGTDTLAITVTGDVTALQGKVAGIETVTATASTGNIGTVETAPAVAVKQVNKFTLEAATTGGTATYAATDVITVTLADKSKVVDMTGVNNASTAGTAIATAIEALMDAAYGAATYTDAATTAGVVAVTSGTAGIALPSITVTGTATGGATLSWKATSGATANPNTANVEASSYVAASTFAIPASATTATLVADKQVNASASKTTDVTATAGTKASITTAKDVTVTSTGGATVKGAVGAVKVTEKGTAGAVVVEGGTTVSITKTGSASTGGTAYTGDITVGAAASYSNKSVTTDGYPEIDANVAKQPKGDVTINNSTAYTSTTGQASKVYGAGAATVYANGATNVSVATAGVITVQDVQVATRKATADATAVKGAQTLSSVTIDGSNAAATITSDALTSLKVINAGASSAVTVTNATTGGYSLALTVGNSGTSFANDLLVTADTATSVSIATEAQSISTAANNSASFVDLNAAAATSLTFNNAHAVTLAGNAASTLDNTTKVTSITLSGSGATDLGPILGATKLTTINASAATGAVKVTLPATSNVGITVTGGAGNDVVTLDGNTAAITSTTGAGVTTTIALGAGNDSVVKGAAGVIGAGSSVSGGEGSDTISASLLNAGNAALVTGFEILGLDLTTGTYDTNLLVGATGLELLATGATAYTNVEQAQSLSVNKNVGGTNTLTFTAADVAGTADAYSVNFAAEGAATSGTPTAISAGTLVIAGIEKVTVNSGAAKGYVDNQIALTASKLKTVTITGAAEKTTLTFVGGNGANNTDTTLGGAVSSIDASAATGAVIVNTTNVTADSSTVGLTVTTGAGKDEITLAQKATVVAGAGADTITTSATGGKLTGGAGADSFNVEAAIATDSSEASILTTITDLEAKDKIKLLAGATAFTSTKVALTATTLAGAIGEATATANAVAWFQYGGDTYIVSNNGTAGFAAGDLVVKVTGLVTLTNSTLDTTTDYLTIV